MRTAGNIAATLATVWGTLDRRWTPWWSWHVRHHADVHRRVCSYCRRRRAIGAERLTRTRKEGTRK